MVERLILFVLFTLFLISCSTNQTSKLADKEEDWDKIAKNETLVDTVVPKVEESSDQASLNDAASLDEENDIESTGEFAQESKEIEKNLALEDLPAVELTEPVMKAAPRKSVKRIKANPVEKVASPVRPLLTVSPKKKPIPTEAIWKKGEILNRYYEVRATDTPQTIADRLYGRQDSLAQLQAWNGSRWKNGDILLYVSPLHPNDLEMKSFQQDLESPVVAKVAQELVENKPSKEATISAVELTTMPESDVSEAKLPQKEKRLADMGIGDYVGKYISFIIGGLMLVLGSFILLRKLFSMKST